MSSPAAAVLKPLPLGQVLYAIHDTAVISVPQGANNAQFHRLSFTGTDKDPVVSIQDQIELGTLDEIRSARSVTDWNGTPAVAILSKSGLSVISMMNGSAHS